MALLAGAGKRPTPSENGNPRQQGKIILQGYWRVAPLACCVVWLRLGLGSTLAGCDEFSLTQGPRRACFESQASLAFPTLVGVRGNAL